MKKLTILSLMLLTFMVMGCNNQPKDKTLTDGTFHSVGLNLTGTINVDNRGATHHGSTCS